MTDIRDWTPLYKTGSLAALLAAVFFRRNLGAELSLFTGVEAIPQTAVGWYDLLQSNPLIGLTFLALFDLVNYALVGLIFLALGAAFWQTNKSVAAVALAGGFVGIAVSFASNISLTMLSLSQQYAVAATTLQSAGLLDAGQSVLAVNNPLAVFPGTGAYVSLLFIAVAGLLFSALLLSTHPGTAVIGLLASGCDLAYCLTLPLGTALPVYLFLAAAGLFWTIWHLLVARVLWQRAKQ
jgi:hypothetical protein